MDPKKPPFTLARPHLAVDRYGRYIEPGHLVQYHSPIELVFEVVDVRAVLNPVLVAKGMQAMQLTLRAQFPIQIVAAQPDQTLVIIGDSQARAKALAEAGKDGQPQEPEPSLVDITDPRD